MKHTIIFCSICLFILPLLSSCASDGFLNALKIDTSTREDQKSADQKIISDLKKQLSRAKQNEMTLTEQVQKLKDTVDSQEAQFNRQLTEIETLSENKEASYNLQIGALKSKLDDQEALITIQGKVIGLLDDADQTLQKSIEDQLRDR